MRELIPILGMILVLGPIATWAFSVTPLGRALVDRLKGRSAGSDETFLEMQDEVDRLNVHLDSQDQRIEELHDRLDFTERLLASGTPMQQEVERVPTPV